MILAPSESVYSAYGTQRTRRTLLISGANGAYKRRAELRYWGLVAVGRGTGGEGHRLTGRNPFATVLTHVEGALRHQFEGPVTFTTPMLAATNAATSPTPIKTLPRFSPFRVSTVTMSAKGIERTTNLSHASSFLSS